MDKEEVDLKIEVMDKAGPALKRLADALERAAAAEKDLAVQAERLAKAKKAGKTLDGAIEERRTPTFREKVATKIKERQEAVKLDAAVRAGTRTGADRMMGAAGGIRGMSGGMTSMLGRAGPYGAIAAAGVEAMDKAASKAADAINIMQNSALTAAQKNESLKAEFIPLYQSTKKLREAIDGTTKSIADSARRLEIGKAYASSEAMGQTKMRSIQHETSLNNYRAGEFSKSGIQNWGGRTSNTYDRSSSVGAGKYQEQEMRLPAFDARRRAVMERNALRQATDSQGQISKKSQEEAQSRKQMADEAWQKVQRIREKQNETGVNSGAKAQAGGFTKADLIKAAADAELKRFQATKATEQSEAEIMRHKERINQLSEAEKSVRAALVEESKVDLEILKQKEDRMQSYAQRLGGMNEADFEQNKEILKQIQQTGIENMPQELVDQAATIAPEYIAKEREKLGEKRAAGLQGELGGIDDRNVRDFQGETLKGVRSQVDKVRADVRVAIDLDTADTAKQLADFLNPLLLGYKKNVEAQVELQFRERQLDQVLRHAGEG